jgi:hypothetical protein
MNFAVMGALCLYGPNKVSPQHLRTGVVTKLRSEMAPMGDFAKQFGHTRMIEKHCAHLAPSFIAVTPIQQIRRQTRNA